MILPVLDIEAKINGQYYHTYTVGDLERLHHDIGEVIRWLKAAPQIGAFNFDVAAGVAPAQGNSTAIEVTETQGVVVNAPTHELAQATSGKMTVAEYVAAALHVLGGSAAYASVLDTMQKLLGWETRASNRKNALRTLELAARQRSDLMEVGGGTMILLEKGREPAERFASQLQQTRPASEATSTLKPPAAPSKPALGERAIDTLVLALHEAGKPIAYRDAPALVTRYGWDVVTGSANPVHRVNSKARKYPELVIATDGRYWLTDKGRRRAQEVKSIREAVISHEHSRGTGESIMTQAPEASLFNDGSLVSQAEATERHRLNPPRGRQLIDLMLHATAREGGAATMNQVIEIMLESGWQTKSETLPKKRRTVQAALYNFPGNFHYADGILTITPQGYGRLRDTSFPGKDQPQPIVEGE